MAVTDLGTSTDVSRAQRRMGLASAMVLGSIASLVACGSSGNSGPAGVSSGGANALQGSGGSAAQGGASNGGVSNGGASNGGTATSNGGSSGTNGGAGTGNGTGGTSDGGTPPGDDLNPNSYSVLQRGHDLFRHGTFKAPELTVAAAKTMAPDTTFNTNAVFPGNGNRDNQGVASVLYLQEGPTAAGCPATATGCQAAARAAGAGLFFAFPALGADPNIVAFDETSGLPVWTAHVTPGGDGIRGTPVIDPTSRRLFLVTGPNPHMVRAISVDDGTEVKTGGWPITLSKDTLSYNGHQFTSDGQNEHGALLLLKNTLYVPFGGEYGDGGSYRGWIVAVDITNPTRVAGWATQSTRAGIWGSGGLASDGKYVFGVTGDSTSVERNVADSEEVVRVSGLASFTRDAASLFVPTEWRSWDRPAGDLDFGASTPAFVPLPAGSNPPSLLVAPAKAGRIFFLNGANLSGGKYPTPGGSLAELTVSNDHSESVYTSPTIYTSASGLHATINVGDSAANCPNNDPGTQEAIVSVLITPGQSPIAAPAWCAPGTDGGHRNYPPISTTSDGVSADALVWYLQGNQLDAVDGDTGKEVFTTTGATCDQIPSMSFPIAVKNRIVVSALGHLCSWSPNGT